MAPRDRSRLTGDKRVPTIIALADVAPDIPHRTECINLAEPSQAGGRAIITGCHSSHAFTWPVKRVATALGEGLAVIRLEQDYLATREAT